MKKKYAWAVIGAGPAGIITVGQLLDQGIDNIVWIDPQFQVGDFASKWHSVSSNTTVELFSKTLQSCASFSYHNKKNFALAEIAAQQTCPLAKVAEPLHWITTNLAKRVQCVHDKVTKLSMQQRAWQLQLQDNISIAADNVVLAIGAEPLSLPHDNIKEVPLTTALDQNKLAKAVGNDDSIAVFGSSHSAIIILQSLLALGVKKVLNFYRQPLRYALKQESWTLFDNTGLKGHAAEWARTNLHGNLPINLVRMLATDDNVARHLAECNKAIYAIGFKRRHIDIEGMPENFSFNPHCGIIAPGLFGIGIAFPEKRLDPFGTAEHSVGLWKFTQYLNKVLPVWLRYGI